MNKVKNEQNADALKQKILECEQSVSNTKRQMERLQQDHKQSLQEQQKYAGIDLMRDLLPFADNLERLYLTGRHSGDIDAVLEGVDLIRDQLFDVLQKYGLREISGASNPFDPREHEEVDIRQSDKHPDGSVVEVVRSGYRMHDRVLRPSQVVVSRDPDNPMSSDAPRANHRDR